MDGKAVRVATARKQIVVALAGNPNSGKTTIFNNLTGAHQHVGNYPGVTVERTEGRLRHQRHEITIGDLPGTYSLTAYSMEELAARNFLIDEHPDVVVDIVDASNLERNLYLATQFIELGVPLVLAFNMSDLAEARGCQIDTDLLSKLLGVPIIRTVGHKGKGMEELKYTLVRMVDAGIIRQAASISYHLKIEREIARISSLLDRELTPGKQFSQSYCSRCFGCHGQAGAESASKHPRSRWLAVKLLENDQEVRRQVVESAVDPQPILAAVESAASNIESEFGDTPEMVLADQRYGFISGACREAVSSTGESRRLMSEQIDSIVTNRVLGIPIFLGMMYLVFKLTFTLGRPPMAWLERLFAWLSEAVGVLWPAESAGAIKSLVVDGIIGGVGGVLVFLPNILLLFLAIALLEDSGYMARAAFIIDRLMHKIGLHGKSFIPMLIGFGCTVPAIMGTRVLENRRDRLTTMLVLPLMSCGARLPIYMLLIPGFFPDAWQTPVLWLIYLIGIILAVLLAKLLRSSIFRGDVAPFVMELPPYRMPTLKGMLIHMWERGWQFLRKAGTIILGISIILWAMTTYPRVPQSQLVGLDENQTHNARLSYSISGRLGHALEPLMRPIGFDWKTTTAMIGAFAAKEAFVAQLGIVHSLGETDEQSEPLRDVLRRQYTPLQAFCIMLFCLVSAPCMATLAATWKESGSWKWAAVHLIGLPLRAYVITLIVYQIGSALGIGVV